MKYAGKLKIFIIFYLLYFSSCAHEGIDPRLREALSLLSEYKFLKAKSLVEEVLAEDPENCPANFVYELVGFQALCFKIVEINDLLTYIQSSLSPAQSSQVVDRLLRELLSPVEEYARLISSAADVAWEKKCRVKVEDFPFIIKAGKTVSLEVHLSGVMGPVESSFFSFISQAILSAFDFVFSHNLNIGVGSVLELSKFLSKDSFVNLLRSFGNFLSINDEFLSFHPLEEEKSRINNVPLRLSSIFHKFSFIVSDLEKYHRSSDSFVFLNDKNRNKILDYGDRIRFNFYGELKIYSNPITVNPYEFEIPYWVSPDLLQHATGLLERLSLHLKGYPEEVTSWFYISELNAFLLAMGEEPVPNIIAVQPLSFFKNPKPLRSLLPYWYYDEVLGGYSFAIEGEIKEKFLGSFYVQPGDAPHFPDTISFYGNDLNISIPMDCIYVRDSFPDYFTLIYAAFQDPSFNGSLRVNLREITAGGFCLEYDSQPVHQDFNYPDNYSLNKVFAYLSTRFGSYIIPGLDFIFEHGEGIGGLFDYDRGSIIKILSLKKRSFKK